MKPFCKYFDHTLLKPDAAEAQIQDLLKEAAEYGFASVCVNGCYVKQAAEYLSGSDVKVAAVVGFPLGAMSPEAKAAETGFAISDGAQEIDMVINVGAVKDGRLDVVRHEIRLLAELCHSAERPALLKAILETCLLTEEEIVSACRAAEDSHADFVKTSTGFSTGGAKAEHVRLMKATVGDRLQVKASGGIRTLSDAREMIEAGADRLGCSASVSIMKEYLQSSGVPHC